MCAAAKLHIIFIKQHQWLLKAEILFDFLTILQIPYLQNCSLSRLKIQDNKLFSLPKFVPLLRPWNLLRLVVLTFSLRKYLSVRVWNSPALENEVRSVAMTLSSECIMMGRRQGTENQISWNLLWGGPFCFQGKWLVYVAGRPVVLVVFCFFVFF